MYKTPAKSLFLGQNLIFMPECHSTNTVALQLCQQHSTPEGTLVITDCQTAGRGQRGNTWQAEPGMNLTFSLVLKPTFLPVHEQFFLNMVISLGLYDYLSRLLNHEVRIKWPNDLLVADKKVSGVLIENSLQGATITASVVGIGLNVNQERFEHPRAASIHTFAGKHHTLQEVLDELLPAIERRYLQLRQRSITQLTADYYQALYGLGKTRRYKAGTQEFEGEITGVDSIGRLKVRTEDGEKFFALKEIEFL